MLAANSRSRSAAALRRHSGRSGVPGKCTSGDEPARRLGDNMVVGRRTAAGKCGKELLVPGNLPDGVVIVLEEVAYFGPVIE